MNDELTAVAIGGNALLRKEQRGRQDEQLAAALATARDIVANIGIDVPLLLVHGNGPQVGLEALRERIANMRACGSTVCDAPAG